MSTSQGLLSLFPGNGTSGSIKGLNNLPFLWKLYSVPAVPVVRKAVYFTLYICEVQNVTKYQTVHVVDAFLQLKMHQNWFLALEEVTTLPDPLIGWGGGYALSIPPHFEAVGVSLHSKDTY